MTTQSNSSLADSLPRRDIIAICAYLNRANGTKAVDAYVSNPTVHLEKLTAAARMQ
jgi:hypothetical protein